MAFLSRLLDLADDLSDRIQDWFNRRSVQEARKDGWCGTYPKGFYMEKLRCIKNDGHPPPHKDRYGAEWDDGS